MAESSKFVIDASFVLAFLLNDNSAVGNFFEKYKKGEISLYAPYLLLFEVGNALRSSFLRKRITPSQASSLLKDFLSFEIIFLAIDPIATLSFSMKHKVSFYDGSYAALSKKTRYPLLSLDKNLSSY